MHMYVHICALYPVLWKFLHVSAVSKLHVISMPLLPQDTHTYLKALELGKEALHVLELEMNQRHRSSMDCIHFIDVVQQLLAAGTRSTKEWQWQKQLRWECALTRTHTYTCVHVLIA